MTINSAMRAALQSVPGMLGETWTYRTLTSDATSQTARTYSAQTAVGALRLASQDTDQMRADGQLERVRMATVRISDAVSLRTGDQLIEPDGVTAWRVVGKLSSGVGTIMYRVELDTVVRAQAPIRGGDR